MVCMAGTGQLMDQQAMDDVVSCNNKMIPDVANKRCHLCWLGYRHLRLYMKLEFNELASQEAAATQLSPRIFEGCVAHRMIGERQQVTRITWGVVQSARNKLPQLILGLEIDDVHAKVPVACGALCLISITGMSRVNNA